MTDVEPRIPNSESHSSLSTLRGTVERVTFASEETGYGVLRLSVPGRADLVTVVGGVAAFGEGEEIAVEGRWVLNPRWGRQFAASACRGLVPATRAGIERYLGSGAIPGIGRKTAARIVKRFGDDTLRVLDEEPELIAKVKGIGRKRAAAIHEAWRAERAIKDVMIFLQGHGVSPLLAHRIFKEYRAEAPRIVREDPFRLAVDIEGIGFRTADRIAASLGLAPDAPQRACAALLHLLGEVTEGGHVYAPRDALLTRAEAELGVPAAAAEAALETLAATDRVRIEADDARSPIVGLASLVYCERSIAESVRRLSASRARPVAIDVGRALKWYESRASIRLAERQREAIARALTEKLLIVTGGPGTGKTTLLRGALDILSRKGARIELGAPTGRAAKRMSEATGFPARTIHRLLEFEPRARRFARNRDRPIEADLVVIDEASMLDTVLGHHLLAAVAPSSRLILVGDVDQLPSVGPGNVFGDLIASDRVPVIRLTEVFRQAAESWIVSGAHKIRRGIMPPNAPGKGGDFYFIEEDPSAVTDRVVQLVAADIPRRLGVDPITDVQVLCPMNRGPAGSEELNLRLQGRLNPSGAEIRRGERSFRVGDRVMQTRNDYDRDVFNGDLGLISAGNPGDPAAAVVVDFDGRPVAYGASDMDALMLAYACSIHKSQGSEYPVVVVPIIPAHWVMLARNLLYTAVTRARRLVVLVGARRAFGRAVRNDAAVGRRTRLVARLRERVPNRESGATD